MTGGRESEGGKQAHCPRWKVLRRGSPEMPEGACVHEDSIVPPSDGAKPWAPWPQVAMHEGKGN